MKRTLLLTAALVGFVGMPASRAETVVIMHPDAAALAKDQIANLYLGKDSGFAIIDLPESSPVREDFYKKATDRTLAQVKATWSRLMFSGKNQPPKEVVDAAAVKKAVAADPKTIGYIDKSAVDGSVKVVLTLE